jgi:hypothetical protein
VLVHVLAEIRSWDPVLYQVISLSKTSSKMLNLKLQFRRIQFLVVLGYVFPASALTVDECVDNSFSQLARFWKDVVKDLVVENTRLHRALKTAEYTPSKSFIRVNIICDVN